MLIDVRAFGLTLSASLRRYMETRLQAALRPCTGAVTRVIARLTDINATHGGVDKRCSLIAVLRHEGPVAVHGLDSDAYASIDHAATRMRRAVLRTLTRHARRERQRHARLRDRFEQ